MNDLIEQPTGMRKPVCSITLTGTRGDGEHIPRASTTMFRWLPKGYGPSAEDRSIGLLLCLLEGESPGTHHPLVEAIREVVETYLSKHPEDVKLFPKIERRAET